MNNISSEHEEALFRRYREATKAEDLALTERLKKAEAERDAAEAAIDRHRLHKIEAWAERDALRERIRALADEWESQPDLQQKADAKSLRALLGDA